MRLSAPRLASGAALALSLLWSSSAMADTPPQDTASAANDTETTVTAPFITGVDFDLSDFEEFQAPDYSGVSPEVREALRNIMDGEPSYEYDSGNIDAYNDRYRIRLPHADCTNFDRIDTDSLLTYYNPNDNRMRIGILESGKDVISFTFEFRARGSAIPEKKAESCVNRDSNFQGVLGPALDRRFTAPNP